MELLTATGKLKIFFLQLEMFDVCTTGDTAHIGTIFKFLPHARQHGCIDILLWCNDPCLQVGEVTWQSWDEYPVFDISPKKIIAGRNVRGPRGAQQQWLVFSRCMPYPTFWSHAIQVLTNLTVKVGGTSVLLEYERRYVLQLCHQPHLQHIQICRASNGFFSKEK